MSNVSAKTAPVSLWLHAVAGIALLALVIASAYASVPLPGSPVPMTLQSLAVLMAGIWGGARLGAAVLTTYLVLGLLGLPVFAGGSAAPGWAFLLRPTAGFLIAFIPAAFVAGWCMQQFQRRWLGALAALLAGHAVIFAGGTAWLASFIGFERAIAAGILPFIPGTMVKVALGIALALAIRPSLTRKA